MPAKTPAKAAKSKLQLPEPPAVTGYTLGQTSASVDPNELHDLTLPSKQTCQARRPGIEGLIEAGMLDSWDQLTSLVQTEHIAPKTPRGMASRAKVTGAEVEATEAAMKADKNKITTALVLMDKLTVYVVTQPKLWIDYKLTIDGGNGEQRIETDEEFATREQAAAKTGAIAVRRIGIDDKVFLLNWAVGGSSNLATFPEGSS